MTPVRRPPQRGAALSRREHEVMRALARGLTYKQIAEALGLSHSSIRTHTHNTYLKLGATDKNTALIAYLWTPGRLNATVQALYTADGGMFSEKAWQRIVELVLTEHLGGRPDAPA